MIKLKNILLETKNKNLIVVDIQPEYQNYFHFKISDFIDYLFNSAYNNIYYLYNGKDTLGMISEDELKNWIIENSNENIDDAYEKVELIKFWDKGYAFFRYCIDKNIDDNTIVALVKYMIENDVNDSRDLDKKFWDGFINKYKKKFNLSIKEIRNILEFSDDMIYIPELMDFLKQIKGNITVVGGGINECLKEVLIALKALNIKYNIDKNWIY